MKIIGKRIVVTGVGGGINRELVAEIIRCEGEVVAVDINQVNLDKTAALAVDKLNL